MGIIVSLPVSGGHINPAVTIAFAFFKRGGFNWSKVPHYVLGYVSEYSPLSPVYSLLSIEYSSSFPPEYSQLFSIFPTFLQNILLFVPELSAVQNILPNLQNFSFQENYALKGFFNPKIFSFR